MSSKDVPSVPSCSTESGNTKTDSCAPNENKINPAIRWCFTLNNFSNGEVEEICSICSKYCRYTIIGSEVGDKCGTPHLQGYLEFKRKKRPFSLFKCRRIHWKKANGNKEQNISYCTKDWTNEIVLEIGGKKPLKKLACEGNFRKWQQGIIDIVTKEPDDRTIWWFTGKEGGEGKTTFAKYLVRFHKAIILSGKSADMKNGIIEYVKTNGDTPELIILNIPKSFNSEYLSYTGIEEVKDMLFYSGKYEGGMVDGNPPHLIVFSNEYPEFDKCSKDRWQVYNIGLDQWIKP